MSNSRNPYGGTESLDFLVMVCDGYRTKLEGMTTQLDAIEAAVHQEIAKRNQREQRQLPAPDAPPEKRARGWSQAQKDAQSKRMKKAWKVGKFSKKEPEAPKRRISKDAKQRILAGARKAGANRRAAAAARRNAAAVKADQASAG